MAGQITKDFVLELFKTCLRDKQVFEIVRPHLKYTFLPEESQKKLWKAITVSYSAATPNKLPTFGMLSQQHASDVDVLDLLNNIKEIESPDKKAVLDHFELFIKQSKFVEAYDKLGDLYNEGNKDKAFDLMNKVSEEIANFTLKTQYFESVFEGFDKRHRNRVIQKEKGVLVQEKIPFGITPLDNITRGGIPVTDTVLFLAQSGVGKTKLLRWMGVQAAKRGYKVLHIQLEGSRDECYDGYDATWGNINVHRIETADVGSDYLKKMQKSANDLKIHGGEIFIEAYEKFDSATCVDVRNSLIEAEKVYGHIDIILIDYLELLEPGDGKHYSPNQERFRREAIGKYLKNIAIEFKTRVVTATQASSVSPDLLNKETFVMTRYNVSEFKNIIAPFSFFITINQTNDEKDMNIIRMHNDKLRKIKAGQTFKIVTNYDNEQFFDKIKTEKLLKEVEQQKSEENGKKK